MSCGNKMNGITNEALTYSKAPLIESVFHNPIMKAIGGKIMNEIPNNLIIVTNVCVICIFLCYLLMNIPMKHRTIKAIASPPSTAGMSFNISFTLSNAPLNVRLS